MNDQDPGDEDDLADKPRRFWPLFFIGKPIVVYSRKWFREVRTPESDPGDEQPNLVFAPPSFNIDFEWRD